MTVTSQRQTTVVGRLSNVNKFYGGKRILDDISLEIRPARSSRSSGAADAASRPYYGCWQGFPMTTPASARSAGAPAVAFQEPRLFPWRDVLTNVSYGLNRTGLVARRARARSERALAEIGLTDHARAWPLTLSGGQAQRVSLARALVAEPQLLLLDEPFGALDALTRLSMRALLLDLWRDHGFGVLLVTHDVDEAVELADRVLVLERGPCRALHHHRIAASRCVGAHRPA